MSSSSPSSSSSPLAFSATSSYLRDRQIEAIRSMLTIASSSSSSSSSSSAPAETYSSTTSDSTTIWKVLVYDRIGQDIISPLLKVGELREIGVTLHLQLHTDRESIQDVAAVYFVMPTHENIQRIIKDCKEQLYDSIHLNFVSSISRHNLEELASGVAELENSTPIVKLYDQHLNFVTLERDMFILRSLDQEKISFYALNNPSAKDTDIENAVDTIVDELVSVLVTMSTIPVIRCARGNAAQMVAERLDSRLRDQIKNKRSNLLADAMVGPSSLQRPVLILLDRNIDLTTLLQHTWAYQSLLHDVMDYSSNRITLVNNPSTTSVSQGKKPKSFDLDPSDAFWMANRSNPFPTVAIEIETAANNFKTQFDEITKLSSSLGIENASPSDESMLSAIQGAIDANGRSSSASSSGGIDYSTTQKLTAAVQSLPELTEKKKLIDMHTTIATALLDSIKARQLDFFFEMEESIINKSSLTKPVLDVLRDPSVGLAEDKLRLFIIYYLLTDIKDSELPDYEKALADCGADLAIVNYVKRLKALNRMINLPQASGSSAKMTFNKVLEHGSNLFKQGVKNLLPTKQTLPVTRTVEAIMEGKSSEAIESFLSFDPKMVSNSLSSSASTKGSKTVFQEAIIFVVGGGTYSEYHNLQEYAKKNQSAPKRITYGATELLNARRFLEQLAYLGRN